MSADALLETVQYTLGSILVIAGIAKATSPVSFASLLEEKGLRLRLPIVSALTVIALELGLGAIIVLRPEAAFPLLVAACVFFAFAAMTVVDVRKRKPGQCGCLGKSLPIHSHWSGAAANLALGVGAVGVAVVDRSTTGDPLDRVVLIASGLLWAMLYWLVLYARSVLAGVRQQLESPADV